MDYLVSFETIAPLKKYAIATRAQLARLYKYIRDDSILAALAVAGILALTAKYLAPTAFWPWLISQAKVFFLWLKSTHLVFGWVIAIGLIFALYSLVQIGLRYKRWLNEKKKPVPPDYLKYVNDEFYGFNWIWTWEKYYGKDYSEKKYPAISETQFCPKCLGDLTRNTHGRDLLQCINIECRYSLFNSSPYLNSSNINEQLVNQILINVRNGTYKKRIQ